jgi:hypothetical protein
VPANVFQLLFEEAQSVLDDNFPRFIGNVLQKKPTHNHISLLDAIQLLDHFNFDLTKL